MKSKILILVLLFGILTGSGYSAGLSSARAVGMGEAYMGLARGVTAPLYNPANLALSEYRESGIEILGVGAEIFNNSFSVNDYNKYTGAVLTTQDKADILSKIPNEGLRLKARAQANAMTVSLGSMVISAEGYASSDLDLGKDVFDLLMNGNTIGDTISIAGTYGEGISYASLGLSFGKSLYKSGTRQLSIGTTIKYIRGIAFEEVMEIEGEASTLMTGFAGSGTVIARTALGGAGYAVDFGAAIKLSDDYTIGASFSNFLSSITWNSDTEEHCFQYQMDTTTIDNMEDDSVVVSEDYTQAIGNFKSRLPTVLRAGIANISGKFKWALDWEQGFQLKAGYSTKPRLMAGAEYRLIGFLPLRAGYSLGGGRSSSVSFGTGLDLSVYYLDLAVTNHGGFASASSKGLHLAVSTGLTF